MGPDRNPHIILSGVFGATYIGIVMVGLLLCGSATRGFATGRSKVPFNVREGSITIIKN